jgi:predicted phosphohydrolase
MTTIGFDLISDLNLSPEDSFNWEGKATSLYCIIAGNISEDLRTIRQTLLHLSKFYQGIFYTLGSLEYNNSSDVDTRTSEIFKLCRMMNNVAIMHHHVVIVDGIAIVGANGWYGNTVPTDNQVVNDLLEKTRNEDLLYLKTSIERLQKHLDVKKIVLVSNSVPSIDLYFGEHPKTVESQLNLGISLLYDTESKVSHWLYGTYDKVVDTMINDINYINNSSFNKNPYWAKRIAITI